MSERRRLPLGAVSLCLPILLLCPVAPLGLAQSALPQVPYTWAPVRIVGGGYVTGMIAHPTEAGLIYARTQSGGAYRWNPTAEVWIPLTDFHVASDYNLQGVESIAIDPADPTRLYIAAGTTAGGPAALLVSTDRGATFTTYRTPGFQMASNSQYGGDAGERLAVNPFNPSELFMGTRTQGLWKSENNAQTWAKVTSFPVSSSQDGYGVNFVVFDPVNSGVVYAGAYTTWTVYKSTDDGKTWNALPNQPLSWPFSVIGSIKSPAPLRAVINPDGNLYVTYQSWEGPGPNPVGATYGLVEKFNPSNNTWTNITPPLDTAGGETAQTGGYCGITQDPTRQGTLAVATLNRNPSASSSAVFNDTIFITHDGGNSWIDLGAITSAAGPYGSGAGGNYFGESVFFSISPWLASGNSSPLMGFGYYMSALLIDPTNPDHFMYDSGATVLGTYNLSAADSGNSPTWTVAALGMESSSVSILISPSAGAHLLSSAITGMRHDDLAVSPAGGSFSSPNFFYSGGVASIDWAGQNPLFIATVGVPRSSIASTSPCNWGGFSTDGGTTWTPFNGCAANAATTLNNPGTLVVDASGTVMMWTPPGPENTAQYSNDGAGGVWSSTSGFLPHLTPVADKVAPRTFYAFDGINFYSTAASGGSSFAKVNTTTFFRGMTPLVPVVNFARAGDIWLPAGGFGLYHSIDGGVTWTALSTFIQANLVSVGAANPRSRTRVQAVFVYGVPNIDSPYGVYRSDDNGATWVQVSDAAHQYGGAAAITADTRVYGRVFVGTNGRGIVYGEIPTELLGSGGVRPQ